MLMTVITPSSLVQSPEFSSLSDHVIGATGLCYFRDHQESLAVCLAERMCKRGLSECGPYLELLRENQDANAELDSLVELLTIGETYFFRHQELFEALKTTVFPEIIRKNENVRRMRIWSAGCSFGAEAYSLSILLRRELGGRLQGWDVSILGTDINRKFLARAAHGCFEDWALREISDELRAACFRREGKLWRIDPRYQDGVSFQYHNLARHPFPSLVHNLFAFDLILCRNVLIYFGLEVSRRVADQAHHSLVEGGWLAVGPAEYSVELFRHFETVSIPQVAFYRRREGSDHRLIETGENEKIITERFDLPSAGFLPSSLFPRPPESVGKQAQPLVKTENTRQLLTAKTAAPASGPSPNTELLHLRQLADRGEIGTALKLCQQLLVANRMDPVCHFYYGLLLDQVAPHERAEEALRRAIYLDRDFALAHYYLGLVQLKQNLEADAIRSFRNVVRLLDQNPPDELVPNSDGLAVGELQELAHMHIETLNEP